VWDIMLELACAEAEGRPFYVSCAGIAASIPATTALRCLERMICKGLLVRREDPLDKRRSLLSLTSAAVGPLSAFLADMDGVEPLAAADRR
jgi:DNA-binding MarR family transcriptional regulator